MRHQFTVQVQIRNAKSYHINSFDYLDVALNFLEEYIKKDKHYRRPYYVYNEFYNNVFPEEMAVSRYKVLVREVGEWYDFHNLSNFIEKDIDKEILM